MLLSLSDPTDPLCRLLSGIREVFQDPVRYGRTNHGFIRQTQLIGMQKLPPELRIQPPVSRFIPVFRVPGHRIFIVLHGDTDLVGLSCVEPAEHKAHIFFAVIIQRINLCPDLYRLSVDQSFRGTFSAPHPDIGLISVL